MKVCPNCGGKRFTVNAHVVQEWIVDEYEMYEDTLDSCVCVTHHPDDEDIWQCYECGYDAVGSKFNVKE